MSALGEGLLGFLGGAVQAKEKDYQQWKEREEKTLDELAREKRAIDNKVAEKEALHQAGYLLKPAEEHDNAMALAEARASNRQPSARAQSATNLLGIKGQFEGIAATLEENLSKITTLDDQQRLAIKNFSSGSVLAATGSSKESEKDRQARLSAATMAILPQGLKGEDLEDAMRIIGAQLAAVDAAARATAQHTAALLELGRELPEVTEYEQRLEELMTMLNVLYKPRPIEEDDEGWVSRTLRWMEEAFVGGAAARKGSGGSAATPAPVAANPEGAPTTEAPPAGGGLEIGVTPGPNEQAISVDDLRKGFGNQGF